MKCINYEKANLLKEYLLKNCSSKSNLGRFSHRIDNCTIIAIILALNLEIKSKIFIESRWIFL